MNTDTLNDELLKRYLLDDVSDDERQEVEARFFEDDSFFEEMLSLEDELHYEYRQNRLSPREQYHFERKFLQSAKEREKSAFADAFLKATADFAEKTSETTVRNSEEAPVSMWRQVSAFFSFSGSAMQFGLSAAVILLAFGLGIVLFKNAQMQRDMASLESSRNNRLVEQEQIIAEKQRRQEELEQQHAAEKLKGEQNEKKLLEIQLERENLKREIAEARRQVDQPLHVPQTTKIPSANAQRSFVALILSPGWFTRGGGDRMKQVKLTPAIRNLQLSLLSENTETYQSYRAVLKTLDEGREVWTNENLKSRGKSAKKNFSLNVPTKILQRADYEISLVGVKESGETEEIMSYYFSVQK
jgi:anti-sigma factor RsiW